MSEVENVDLENDFEIETEVNPVMDLISALQGQDYNVANDVFNNVLSDKVAQSLDAYKVDIADQIFNGVEVDEVDEEPTAELDDDVEFDDEVELSDDEFDENDS
jgi:hypothetical protein